MEKEMVELIFRGYIGLKVELLHHLTNFAP